ncbi:hypothetical protein BDB00DRAFT_871753 [Zychaea mexicana]|uniref:uncharacterized protein n=1 Tax=Zychaea mexicana TaxID=64656 RepID=UPI0022FDF011|nr:uncharacterized protein BDB00DRAFT_871753 [Zychaea mexicana]KAI9493994.1 hypothetical protein BDB00DRAFT_871753 [Zychaea mexicana]
MGANHSKVKHRRSSNNKARHIPPTVSATSLTSAAPSSSSPQPQPQPPRPLRSQQLQQQRQQVQQNHHTYHNDHPPTQPSGTEQQQQLHHRSPYSSHRPSSSSISQPVLIEDDDESTYERRLSIDFYSSDTINSAILIKSHIMEESRLHDDRLPSDPPEYVPPTLSSTSSTTSIATTSMFSTASSPSSMSSVSSIHSKFAPPAQSPALIRVLQKQRQTSTTNLSQTASSDKVSIESASRPAISGSSDINSLVTSANDDSTLVSQTSTITDEQKYRDLENLALREHIEAFYPYAVYQYYGKTPSRKPHYGKAFRYFQAAAKANKSLLEHQPNHPQRQQILGIISSSLYCIGDMLANGKGVSVDAIKSLRLFNAAAKNRYAPAEYMVGYYYQHGKAGLTKNIQAAYKWYSLAAEQGYAKAQAAYGALLLEQLENNVDNDRPQKVPVQQALNFLHSAAEQNNAEALLQLGLLYEEGRHVHKSLHKAFDLYERFLDSADNGRYGATHYMMGVNYRHGSDDLKRSDELALKHFHLSAESGFAQAQRVLGNLYADGIGVEKDDSEAHRLFQKAAAQGDLLAICWLGKQFEYGRGCIKNTQRAIGCYETVARQPQTLPLHCVPAQLALAMLLDSTGRRSEALEWFQKVAASGDFKKAIISRELESMFMHKLALYRNTARLHIAMYQLHGVGSLQRDPAAAFNLLRNLADTEDFADAHYRTARAFQKGIPGVVERNLKLAHEYFRKAADLGHVLSQFHAADMLSNGFTYTDEQGVTVSVKDREQAYYLYAGAAAKGHELSQACEAVYYVEGLAPVYRDLTRAEELLRSAATRGLPEAMVTLARMLVTSVDTVAEAHMWLLKAESKDDTSALRELAAAYEMDLLPVAPGKTNFQEGYERLEKAASMDDPRAWFKLAQYHEKGWFVEPCIENQYECLKKSEDLGYDRASFAIAVLLESQAERDLAFLQYSTIVERHNLSSQYGWHARLNSCRLVVLHNLRDSKEQSTTYMMLQEMVKHGDLGEKVIEPLELLGVCCEHGIGTFCDSIQATVWYRRAVNIQVTSSIHWAQDRTRSRLAKLLIDQGAHAEALQHLQQLQPRLDRMMGNQDSSETVMQAREARYYLGYLLLHGKGIKKNEQEAKIWLTVAADQGHGDAAYELGLLAVQEARYEEARRRFDQGVTSGHRGSMRELAMLFCREQQSDSFDYDEDDISQWDTSQIRYLLEDAESGGDVEALVQIGLLHESGFGSAFSKDLGIALEFYTKAFNCGHSAAAVYKGEIYNSLGRYIDAMVWFNKQPTHWIARFRLATYRILDVGELGQDKQQGFDNLRTVVESTTAPSTLHDRKIWCSACVFLGSCYQRGEGMEQDIEKAIYWYMHGADLERVKYTEAMLHLGDLYNELGEETNALQWFHEAAARKNMRAQFQMGLFHKNGFARLEPNPAAAARYFTTAKNQGHGEAAYELALIYWEQGNYEAGWDYYKLAAEEHQIAIALREIGYIYHRGFSGKDRSSNEPFLIVQNRKLAFSYFCRAAEFNDSMSIAMVGSYYQEGYQPYSGDSMEFALACYEKAYQNPQSQNRPILQLVIGRLIHIMANECADLDQARELHLQAYAWFDKAVREPTGVQTSYAQMMVALYHLHGWHPSKHHPELGFQELLEIETEGEIEVFKEVSQHIARCYEDGHGVQQDYSKALVYWKRLVELGDEQALQCVVEYYRNHRATDADLESAQRSFEAAKEIEANTTLSGSSYGR